MHKMISIYEVKTHDSNYKKYAFHRQKQPVRYKYKNTILSTLKNAEQNKKKNNFKTRTIKIISSLD